MSIFEDTILFDLEQWMQRDCEILDLILAKFLATDVLEFETIEMYELAQSRPNVNASSLPITQWIINTL